MSHTTDPTPRNFVLCSGEHRVCFSTALGLLGALIGGIASILLPLNIATAAAMPTPNVPEIAARGYLLQDFNSGQIIAEKNSREQMEPASLTKLMTAHIVFSELRAGNLQLNSEVLISEKAWRMGGSRMFVEVNKRVSVENLLKGMIIQSGNDASVALAEHVAGSEEAFASLMNHHAEKLGMRSTHFVNSTGMPDSNHYTTAHDLALLTKALISEFPEYYKWYSIKEFTYNDIRQHNRNTLLWRDKYVDGVKTGHTDSAGFCLISSALRDDMRLISVVLGTKSKEARAKESQKLLNYGFRFFETRQLYSANSQLTTSRIWKGASEQLPLGIADDLYITIPRGRYDKLDASMKIDSHITAPTTKGSQHGIVDISLEGETIVERPLIALQGIEEGSLLQRLSDEFSLLFE